eukprot:TRINITY_DN10269_c0_g1_i1.p2 TRINITY_DN10269_c0_g1~~TRINITY_DN10269_c0_g1_i1.p2  ORF type:complete len:75 (+),score=15.02 TRINITY_DN10269_c0_g1_i1:236-460(+)
MTKVANREFLDDLKSALTGPGFFYVKNHGLDDEILEQSFEDTYTFFEEMSKQEKSTLRDKSSNTVAFEFRKDGP